MQTLVLAVAVLLHKSVAQVVPPSPNDPTCMTMVSVPNATDAGAIYPSGEGAKFELNFTGSTGWVVHLSGGGWRFFANESNTADVPFDKQSGWTRDAMNTPSGAGPCSGCYKTCDGLMSNLPNINPAYHGYNKVFVPISGTSFTGDRESLKPYPVRGARILKAVVEYLQSEYGMDAATEVILTGTSSGGLATYLVCDRVGGMVASANASTRYSCLADAGFFLDSPTMAGAPSFSPMFEQSFYAWNSSGGMNQDCIAHYTALGTPEKCIFAENVLPFIKSPLFIAQNLDDSFQINNFLKIGCGGYNKPMTDCNSTQFAAVHAYAATMRERLAKMPKGTGAFAPTCIAHGQTIENEHPAGLWAWPERWGIGTNPTLIPRDVYMAWKQQESGGRAYAAASTSTSTSTKTDAMRRETTPTVVIEQCDWNKTTCNTLCPLFT